MLGDGTYWNSRLRTLDMCRFGTPSSDRVLSISHALSPTLVLPRGFQIVTFQGFMNFSKTSHHQMFIAMYNAFQEHCKKVPDEKNIGVTTVYCCCKGDNCNSDAPPPIPQPAFRPSRVYSAIGRALDGERMRAATGTVKSAMPPVSPSETTLVRHPVALPNKDQTTVASTAKYITSNTTVPIIKAATVPPTAKESEPSAASQSGVIILAAVGTVLATLI